MRDWLGVRLTAAVVLLLGVLAAPGSGLTHGAAHLREARHLAEHERDEAAHHEDAEHHGPHDVAAEVATAPGDPRIGATDDHRAHDHAQVDDGLRPRTDGTSLLRAERVTLPAARERIASTATVVPHAALPRADPATGPPPRLRAPPAA
ncbi:MAG TPA: hypothetical protein VEA99_07025 [Gemmatimonadaceae bacterium]|nr:hypothetical protein [Gemmatimonadaceae bacterium]